MTHTCVDNPILPCPACVHIEHLAELQSCEYRRQRASEVTYELVEDDIEQARR